MGIDPEKYYTNTIRTNAFIAKAWEHKQLTEWERTRYLAFSMYSSTIGFDGKQPFKKLRSPKDLFPLKSDKIQKPEVLEGEAAQKYLKAIINNQ